LNSPGVFPTDDKTATDFDCCEVVIAVLKILRLPSNPSEGSEPSEGLLNKKLMPKWLI
jgi:hypothetical protein